MIKVVGGTYNEFCADPLWRRVFGSGLRGATALSTLSDGVELTTFVSASMKSKLNALAAPFGISIDARDRAQDISFTYTHPLADPYIWPRPISSSH